MALTQALRELRSVQEGRAEAQRELERVQRELERVRRELSTTQETLTEAQCELRTAREAGHPPPYVEHMPPPAYRPGARRQPQ
jgi:predicted  nucleic acid-binding Zn-ribbon protein